MRPLVVFGANTDVGKTIVSGGLMLALSTLPEFASKLAPVYVKPVQTGGPDVDAAKIREWTRGAVETATVFAWPEPASPHIAARGGQPVAPSRGDFVRSVKDVLAKYSTHRVVVETAGGVLSPLPDGRTLQADAYRELMDGRARAVLVGDPKLGGISTTLSAYESLKARNIPVMAHVILTPDSLKKYENAQFLRERLDDVLHVDISGMPENPTTNLSQWLRTSTWMEGMRRVLA